MLLFPSVGENPSEMQNLGNLLEHPGLTHKKLRARVSVTSDRFVGEMEWTTKGCPTEQGACLLTQMKCGVIAKLVTISEP